MEEHLNQDFQDSVMSRMEEHLNQDFQDSRISRMEEKESSKSINPVNPDSDK